MSSLNTDDIDKSFKKKGFVEKNKDHKYYIYHTISGEKTSIYTKISHSGKQIGDNLINQMSKQIKVTSAFFKEFVKCSKNQEDYEKHLILNNYLKQKN